MAFSIVDPMLSYECDVSSSSSIADEGQEGEGEKRKKSLTKCQ